jgi:syntaxin 5
VHNERRQLFSAQPDGGAGLLETAPLLGGSSSSSSSSSRHPAAADGSSSSSRPTAAGLFGQQQQQQQQQQGGGGGGGMLMQQQYVPRESAYSQSRAEALQNVETTIVELGSIFTQLAEMVAAQVCVWVCFFGGGGVRR